jgi:DNA-binding transcriptional regulator PaaX
MSATWTPGTWSGEEARAAFHKLTSEVAPRNLEVLTAAASFERRQGNKEVCPLLCCCC